MQALSDEQQLERLEKKVDDGFAEMRAEFRAIRTEMRAESASVRAEFGSVRAELGALARTTFWGMIGLYATMIFGFVGIVVAMLAHG